MKHNSKILIAGLTIIIVTNVVALAGVAYNRSGEPDAVVELTERELSMPYRYGMDDENTGLGLNINCRNCWSPDWLNEEKLIELDFELQPLQEISEWRLDYDKTLPRKVYLVLEYNGAMHQRAVANAEKELAEKQVQLATDPNSEEFKDSVEYAENELNNEQHHNSRLFAIDAGLDSTRLRNAYADTSQYILMQALIRPGWDYNEKEEKEWKGTITELLINTINIPLEHRAVFEPLEALEPRYDQDDKSPRYMVRVAFGKRSEPWVIGVEGI